MSLDSVTGAQFLASLSQCSSPRVPDSDQMSIRSEDDGCPTKVKLMCSYGGRIMPRPHDAQLRYIGGDTRILVVNRNINFADLSVKLSKLCGGRSMFAKYKLPYEDFDALVSVICDEDLETMMEEYDRLEAREAPSRLRLFLFPKNSHINNVMGSGSFLRFDSKIGTAEQRFLDALNSNDTVPEQQQQQIVVPSSELPDFLFGFDPVAAAQEVLVESSGSSSSSPSNSLKLILEADSAMQSGLAPICTAPAVAPVPVPIPAMRTVLVPPAVLQQNPPHLMPQQNLSQLPQSPPQMLQNPSQNLPQAQKNAPPSLPQQAQQNLHQNPPQLPPQNFQQAQQNLPQPQVQQALPQAPQPQLQQTLQQNLPLPQPQLQQQQNQPQPQLQQQQNQPQLQQQQNQPQPQLQQTLQQNLPQPQLQQQQNQQQQVQQTVLPPRGPKAVKSDKKEPKNKDAGSPKKNEYQMNSNSNDSAVNRQIQVQKDSFDQQDAQPTIATSPDSVKIKQRSLDASPESKNDDAHAADEHESVKAKHVVDNKEDGEGKQRNAPNPQEGSADNTRIERQEVSLNVFMEQQKLQEAQLQRDQEQQLKMDNKTSGDDDTKKTQRQEQVFGPIQQQQQHRLEDYTQQQQHLLKQQQQQQHLLMQQQNQQMTMLNPQQQQQFQQHQLQQFQHKPYFIENNVIYFLADSQQQQQQQQQIMQRPVIVNQDGVPIQRVSSDPLAFPRPQPNAAPLPRQMSAQFVDQLQRQQAPSHVRVYPAPSARGSPSRFCESPPPQQLPQQYEVAAPPMTLRAQLQPQQAFIVRQQQGGSHVIDPRMVAASSQQMAFTTSEKI